MSCQDRDGVAMPRLGLRHHTATGEDVCRIAMVRYCRRLEELCESSAGKNDGIGTNPAWTARSLQLDCDAMVVLDAELLHREAAGDIDTQLSQSPLQPLKQP